MASGKHKKACTTLSYIEYFFIFDSKISEYISISDFAFLFGIPIGIMSSAIELKIRAMIFQYMKRSIIKKNKKKHDKIVLISKSKLNSIEVLISKSLISNVSDCILLSCLVRVSE